MGEFGLNIWESLLTLVSRWISHYLNGFKFLMGVATQLTVHSGTA